MSEQAIDVLVLTRTAASAITADRFVGTDDKPAGENANTFGVARSDAASGDAVAVTALGTAVVEAGGAFDAGDAVGSDGDGKAVVVDGTTVKIATGRALADASADGDKVEIVLIPN